MYVGTIAIDTCWQFGTMRSGLFWAVYERVRAGEKRVRSGEQGVNQNLIEITDTNI